MRFFSDESVDNIAVKTFFCSFPFKEHPQFSLIIEDDGRVAYAYFLKHDCLVGDVWLYNQAPTPDKVDWTNKVEMPFLNPAEYVDLPQPVLPIVDSHQIEIAWRFDNGRVVADIYYENELIASVGENDKPGLSAFVRKDGPLAKVLNNHNPTRNP